MTAMVLALVAATTPRQGILCTVEVRQAGIDWPAWVQALGSVLAILVSVGLGLWLQDRDRKLRARDLLREQVAALTAIAETCVGALERLDRRAKAHTMLVNELGWLEDETLAMEGVVSSVDLMGIKSTDVIAQVAQLQQGARTGRRRMRIAARDVRDGKAPATDWFEDPLHRAQRALDALRAMGPQR